MAKGIGLIGNFKGKVGNMVGYQLSDSNTGNTQGIRVYQPNVKNPKTAAQAEQRAKLAPINATYRALKSIIDRGNEGLPYGNKSRLAWLKQAMLAYSGNWTVKGGDNGQLCNLPLTKGSLSCPFVIESVSSKIELIISSLTTAVNTIGALSTVLLAEFPTLKSGDQITFISSFNIQGKPSVKVISIILSTSSTDSLPSEIECQEGSLKVFDGDLVATNGAVVISRMGDNGEHLRSASSLVKMAGYVETFDQNAAKEAAIQSYMASDSVNSDWAEESIQ